jgi:hypothetical protein
VNVGSAAREGALTPTADVMRSRHKRRDGHQKCRGGLYPGPEKFDKGASCGRGGPQRNKQREVGAKGRGWQRQFTTQLF